MLQYMGLKRVGHDWVTELNWWLSSLVQFSSIQSLSRVWLFATQWIAARQASLSITKFTQTHVHWVSDAIQPSHPLSSPSPPAPNPSQHQSLFQWVNSSNSMVIEWGNGKKEDGGMLILIYYSSWGNFTREKLFELMTENRQREWGVKKTWGH